MLCCRRRSAAGSDHSWLVRQLDEFVQEFEHRKEDVAAEVDIYINSGDNNNNNKQQPTHPRHEVFVGIWGDFVRDSEAFLKQEYTPALKERQAASQGLGVHPGDVEVAIPRISSQVAVAGDAEPSPVTPLPEVKRQIDRVQKLHVKFDTALKEFVALQEATQASRGSVATLQSGASAGARFPQDGGYRDPKVQEAVSILKGFRHPLLLKVTARPYSVLRTTLGQRPIDPRTPVDGVAVDTCNWSWIGRANNPKACAGSSRAIYSWAGLLSGPQASFPLPVHEHFAAGGYEQAAETRAKHHLYGPGVSVIHVVPPRMSEVLPSVTDMSHAYLNIIGEFVRTRDKTKDRILRVPPLSGNGYFLVNKRLERHMPEMVCSALALCFAMMPVSMQDALKDVSIELCTNQARMNKAYEDALAAKCAMVRIPFSPPDMGRVPTIYGSCDWVRQKNGPLDRLRRLATMLDTQCACVLGGYAVTPGAPVIRLDVRPMVNGTYVQSGLTPLAKAIGTTPQSVTWDAHSTVMEAAVAEKALGRRVVAVNAATGYHVGGGVLTGGRHALEESWCVTSTLLPSLQEARTQACKAAVAAGTAESGVIHIPVDGCVVSPEVAVFRDGSSLGYGFRPQASVLEGVCSVAMFNMNARVSDSPVDAPRDFKEYTRLVKAKLRAVVAGAAKLRADSLVCPDVGCGVFENNPEVVGALLGEVLRESPGLVPHVILTGKASFATSASQVAEAPAGTAPLLPKAPSFFAEAQAWEAEPQGAGSPTQHAAVQQTIPLLVQQAAPASASREAPSSVSGLAPATAPVPAAAKAPAPAPAPDGLAKPVAKAKGKAAPAKSGALCCGRSAAANAVEPKAKAKAPKPAAAAPKAALPAITPAAPPAPQVKGYKE